MTNNNNKNTSKETQKMMDETIAESFPASDPPAWVVSNKAPVKKTDEEQKIALAWQRNTPEFVYETYNRDAIVTFKGGETLQLSNPDQYYGDSRFANAEELLLASLAFCYMHTYLAIASKQEYKVKHYTDHAVGKLGENSKGQMFIEEIHLNPSVIFEGEIPDQNKLKRLQESAHKHCFIANTICSKITITITVKDK